MSVLTRAQIMPIIVKNREDALLYYTEAASEIVSDIMYRQLEAEAEAHRRQLFEIHRMEFRSDQCAIVGKAILASKYGKGEGCNCGGETLLLRSRTGLVGKMTSVCITVVCLCLAFGPDSQYTKSAAICRVDPALSDVVFKVADVEMSVHVLQSDTKELNKIGSEFSATYSLKNMTLQYKQPDKIRLEGKSATRGNALMLLNGSTRYVDVPRFKIHMTENLGKSPVRRQSMMELAGVIGPDTLTFMKGKYLKKETVDGHDTLVFEMRYSVGTSGQYYRVWVDENTHITVKREWYDADNHLRATFVYDTPKQISDGTWLPSRVQVKNSDGGSAATLTMDDVKINQGLSDSLFEIPQ